MTVYRSRHLKKSLFQLFGFWYACVVKRLPFGLQKATYSDGSDLQNAGDENTQGSLSSDSHGLAYTCCTASFQSFCRMSVISFNVLNDRAFPYGCYRTLVEYKDNAFLGISAVCGGIFAF